MTVLYDVEWFDDLKWWIGKDVEGGDCGLF